MTYPHTISPEAMYMTSGLKAILMLAILTSK